MPRSNSTTWSAWNAITSARLESINTDLDDLYSKGSDRFKVWISSGLTVNIGAGAWRIWALSGVYAGGTSVMTGSATNYVMISSAGTITVSTSAWDDANARIAKVITWVSTVTSIEIWRPDLVGWVLWGGLSIGCSVTAWSQSLNTGGSPVKVNFNTEDFDIASNYDNVTNYRFTAPSAWYYEISAYGEITSLSTGQNCYLYIYKNGAAVKTMNSMFKGANYRECLTCRYILSLAASDYIEVFAAQQASGNTATLQAGANLTINKF